MVRAFFYVILCEDFICFCNFSWFDMFVLSQWHLSGTISDFCSHKKSASHPSHGSGVSDSSNILCGSGHVEWNVERKLCILFGRKI